MSGSLATEANAEPNLTPILDMVFQLITFFMLVINFKANAMDMNMALPVVGSAMPADKGGQAEVMVLNINNKQQITMFNLLIPNIEARIKAEANVSRLKYNLKPGDKLPSTVVVRADAGTRFELLNRVIKACQEQGFRSFSLKALNKADTKKPKKA